MASLGQGIKIPKNEFGAEPAVYLAGDTSFFKPIPSLVPPMIFADIMCMIANIRHSYPIEFMFSNSSKTYFAV